MGLNFRKSIKIGPARVNLSKSGVGYSVGVGGVRYTKRAGSKKKEKATLFGAVCKMIGIAISVLAVMAIAAAVYTFVLRFKWVFIAAGILLIVGLTVYFIVKHRKNQSPLDKE